MLHTNFNDLSPIFYRTAVIADQSFTLPECGFCACLLQWPWPNDLHIWIWQISPQDVPADHKWTGYIKTFGNYCITYVQTERHTAALWVVVIKYLYTCLTKRSYFRGGEPRHLK